MGLDLICGNIGIRVGSYRRVHIERKLWVEAYNNWVATLKEDEEEAPIPINSHDYKITEADMEALESHTANTEVAVEILDGLKRFVIHSDCEGYWSPYDAEAMLTTLDTIKQHFDDDDDDDEYYLTEIFKHSIDTNENIQFC